MPSTWAKHGPTDVLSFPLDSIDDSTAAMPGPVLLGDVVVCPAVASEPRPHTPARSTTSSPCSWCTASSTCSATTTPSRDETRLMRERELERCSSSTTGTGRRRRAFTQEQES